MLPLRRRTGGNQTGTVKRFLIVVLVNNVYMIAALAKIIGTLVT